MNAWQDIDGIAVLQVLSDGVIVVDQHYYVRFVNPAAVQMLNIDVDALLNTPLPEPLAIVATSLLHMPLEVRAGERLLRVERRPYSRTGQRSCTWQVLTLHDVTQDTAAVSWADEMLSMLAFELRSPLSSMHAASDILTRALAGPLNDQQQAVVDIIHTSVRRGLSVINDISDLTRLRREHYSLHVSATQLGVVILDFMTCEAPGATVMVPEMLTWVQLDEQALRRMLRCIIVMTSNSTQQYDHITMRVSLDAGWLYLDVISTLRETRLARLLPQIAAFFAHPAPISEATSNLIDPTIAILKGLVLLHKGMIRCSAYPDDDLTISISIPIEESFADAAEKSLGTFTATEGTERTVGSHLCVLCGE